MSNVIPLSRKPSFPLHCTGVERDDMDEKRIVLHLNRRPSDAELRYLRDTLDDTVHYAYLSTLKEDGES